MKVPVGAIGPLLAALAWTVALQIDNWFEEPFSLLLVSLGLIVVATIATVGTLVVGGRWAYRSGWSVVGATAVLAVLRTPDVFWWVALMATVLGAVLLMSIAPAMRKLPAATGPGRRAVLVPLVLVAVPFCVGLGDFGPSWTALVMALTALAAAFLYARVIFGGLLTVRIGWPVLMLILAPFADAPGAILAVGFALLVGGLAWHPSVKAAFHPAREVGSTFPIPPELTPKEILDAANLDERGRRK